LLKHVRTLGEYFHAALEVLDKKTNRSGRPWSGPDAAVELDSPELAKAVTKATAARRNYY